MTTNTSLMHTEHTEPPKPERNLFLGNVPIGMKLTIGFGILVALTLAEVLFSYLASADATNTINRTGELRVPVALESSRAQADLLRMFGAMRGYLALGDRQFLTSYQNAEDAFRQDLDRLNNLSGEFQPENKRRLAELEVAFESWSDFPQKLFVLRDDQMEREPAYEWLNTDGVTFGGTVLININQMIETQAQRDPSEENNELLRDMAKFQSSFAAMVSGLRGYVTTRNPNFRSYEYEVNLSINDDEWENINQKRRLLTTEQQAMLDSISDNRQKFVANVPEEIFQILQAQDYSWRRDLYLFNSEVQDLTSEMQQLLGEITLDQQQALQQDLAEGRESLAKARTWTVFGGVAAAIIGILLAFVLGSTIAGPIRRLTTVASQIRGGNLEAVAQVESKDEIGVFAQTFNDMTAKLRDTLLQIRKEKKRADDLLNVVIPIGVTLSSERDFNRLLENMLVEAMTFCQADGGTLFLREDNLLRPVMVRITSRNITMGGTSNNPVTSEPIALPDTSSNDEQHHALAIPSFATLNRQSVNVANVYEQTTYDVARITDHDTEDGYDTRSVLAIPLQNSKQEVLGVMELVNAKDGDQGEIIAFDANLQQMMESFSSLAVAALESYIREQKLRQEIQQLRIEIDESKKQKEVSEIVDSDFFQDLRAKARNLRERGQKEREK